MDKCASLDPTRPQPPGLRRGQRCRGAPAPPSREGTRGRTLSGCASAGTRPARTTRPPRPSRPTRAADRGDDQVPVPATRSGPSPPQCPVHQTHRGKDTRPGAHRPTPGAPGEPPHHREHHHGWPRQQHHQVDRVGLVRAQRLTQRVHPGHHRPGTATRVTAATSASCHVNGRRSPSSPAARTSATGCTVPAQPCGCTRPVTCPDFPGRLGCGDHAAPPRIRSADVGSPTTHRAQHRPAGPRPLLSPILTN